MPSCVNMYFLVCLPASNSLFSITKALSNWTTINSCVKFNYWNLMIQIRSKKCTDNTGEISENWKKSIKNKKIAYSFLLSWWLTAAIMGVFPVSVSTILTSTTRLFSSAWLMRRVTMSNFPCIIIKYNCYRLHYWIKIIHYIYKLVIRQIRN